MTEAEFRALKVGDQIMSRRRPGIVLTVTRPFADTLADEIEITNSMGRFAIRCYRAPEFVLVLPQEKLPL